jgi:hypothetical protein
MTAINLGLWFVGIILIGVGYARARPFLWRSTQLREQEDNSRRYEEWRGRLRIGDHGPSSADLMAAELRRRAMPWIGLAGAGVVTVFVGFLIR